MSCRARIFSTPFTLNTPPSLPPAMSSPRGELTALPVVMSPAAIRCSCPIFSSTVILAISSSMNWSIPSCPLACGQASEREAAIIRMESLPLLIVLWFV